MCPYEAANSEKVSFYLYKDNGAGVWMTSPDKTPAKGEWHYHVRRWNGATGLQARTLDDTTVSSEAIPEVPETICTVPDGALCIGNCSAYSNGQKAFHGVIDEVRISKIVRSNDWIEATYDTIHRNSVFAKYSSAREQTRGLSVILK